MATTIAEPRPQVLVALEKANRVRIAACAVRREMKAGLLPLAEAVQDERASSLTVMALVMAQPRWGRHRAVKVLRAERLPEMKRVGSLTDRQRRSLAEACS